MYGKSPMDSFSAFAQLPQQAPRLMPPPGSFVIPPGQQQMVPYQGPTQEQVPPGGPQMPGAPPMPQAPGMNPMPGAPPMGAAPPVPGMNPMLMRILMEHLRRQDEQKAFEAGKSMMTQLLAQRRMG